MGIYTQLHMEELAGAVDKLSELRRSPDQPEQAPSKEPEADNAEDDDPVLGRVVATWQHLPSHIRQTILTLIETASGDIPGTSKR